MKFTLKVTNLDLTSEISDYLEKKINSLDKFIKKPDLPTQAWVELGQISKHHKTGDIYRAEFQIHLFRKSVRAEAVAKTIFKAINEANDEIQRELKRYKGKRMSKQKKD